MADGGKRLKQTTLSFITVPRNTASTDPCVLSSRSCDFIVEARTNAITMISPFYPLALTRCQQRGTKQSSRDMPNYRQSQARAMALARSNGMTMTRWQQLIRHTILSKRCRSSFLTVCTYIITRYQQYCAVRQIAASSFLSSLVKQQSSQPASGTHTPLLMSSSYTHCISSRPHDGSTAGRGKG